jgi:hypothetical protein
MGEIRMGQSFRLIGELGFPLGSGGMGSEHYAARAPSS